MSYTPPPPPDDSDWSSGPPPPPGPAPHSPQAMRGWATLGTGEEVELAQPLRRLAARILDWVVMFLGFLVLSAIGLAAVLGADNLTGDQSDAAVGLIGLALAGAVIGILYEVALIAVKGQTLGKMAVSIKVVRADNGRVPGWGKSAGRWIIPTVANFIPLVGWILSLLVFISLLWDRVRQGWHDKVAGTLVIKA